MVHAIAEEAGEPSAEAIAATCMGTSADQGIAHYVRTCALTQHIGALSQILSGALHLKIETGVSELSNTVAC